METVKVVCVRAKGFDVLTLVFDIVADYNQNLESWDAQSGHGSASIDFVEYSDSVPHETAIAYLNQYKAFYGRDGVEYVVVGKEDFVTEYF